MALDGLKKEVCDAVDSMRETLVGISAEIHANPELSFQEVKASQLLAATLTEAGLPVTRRAFGVETAFASEFGSSNGPCVGIIAEYDALPGIGHACGHNIIGTAALGATLALARLRDRLPGRVRLLGTPAEEQGGGKEIMARHGAFAQVDCAMMVHPAAEDLPTYRILARAAVAVAYRGRASHASAEPESGINALDAIVTAYQAIAAWRQHMPPGHRIHGIITDGGQAPNIVPERAAGSFAVRAPDREGLKLLRQRLDDCFRAGALASGCEVMIDWDDVEYLDLITNWPLARAYQANAEALGRRFKSLDDLPANRAASTDMGNVSHRVPSIHPMIAAVRPGVAFHSVNFARDAASELGVQAMIDGAKAMAMTAIDYFTDQKLRAEVRQAFAKSTRADL
jgi:amidohydrolase